MILVGLISRQLWGGGINWYHQNRILLVFTHKLKIYKFLFLQVRILASYFIQTISLVNLLEVLKLLLGVENSVSLRSTKANLVKPYIFISHHREHYYRRKYCKFMKKSVCFLTKHSLRNTNQIRMSLARIGKSLASYGITETVLWDRYLHQVPEMVGTIASTNEKHNFYNSMGLLLLLRGGDCATKDISQCACFFTWNPRKNPGRKWAE